MLLLIPVTIASQAKDIEYCDNKIQATIDELKSSNQLDFNSVPWHVLKGGTKWTQQKVDVENWTCGFWAGELWLDYQATGNQRIKDLAESYTQALDPITRMPVFDHDLGFVIYTSYGKAYAATGKDIYKKGIINAAERLCDLYNPKVGTMLSWPRNVEMFGGHHTIMDNMINLELLFAASRLSGNNKYHDIAFRHAETTMKNHFRDDYTSYHVVIYDSITGKKVRGVTHQGYSDQSMWARGQAWAIYGFTMTYRETRDSRFLDFAQKVADLYIQRLPKDRIPYWDFDDPKIPNSYKDVSAACIVASALIELSGFVGNEKGNAYLKAAKKMLKNIKKRYSSKKANSAMLMHAVGNLPAGSEIDASIIYADYYYMEALSRLSDKVGKGRCDSLYANSR